MERDDKSPYSEANQNLADFSWVGPELQKINDKCVSTRPKLAKLDYWNTEKGFGFIYVDPNGSPSEKNKPDAKRVFVHANNVSGFSRGEKLEGVVIDSICDGEKGPILRYGSTLEYWEEKEEMRKKSENNKELSNIFSRVHEQNQKLWKEKVAKKMQEKILEVQKPHYEMEKELCPDCKTEVGSGHPCGTGWEYKCSNCNWTYYFHISQRMAQISYSESDDGMRPAGYYDTLETAKDEEGTAPITVPSQSNAAYKVRRLEDSALVIRRGPSFEPYSMSQKKSFSFIKEYTHLVDEFPEVPQESDPEVLYSWGQKATESIVKNFSEKMK